MLKERGTIRFILRTDKLLKNGKAPLAVLYQVAKQRKYFSTGITLYPQSWDAVIQQPVFRNKKDAKALFSGLPAAVVPTENEIKNLMHEINAFNNNVRKIEDRFKLDCKAYTAEDVIEKLKESQRTITIKKEKANVIYKFMEDYVEEHQEVRQKASLSVYKSVANHLKNYSEKYGRTVTFENIDISFFESFQNYLLNDKKDKAGKQIRGLNNTTTAKQLSTVKTFLSYAKKYQIKINDAYRDFKIKREKLKVIALNEREFETLIQLDLSKHKRLDKIRDIFCFSCATGLRFSDLKQLSREHIAADHIELVVTKTKEHLIIPLNNYSRSILNKYGELHKPIPEISNQKANEYVKELGKLAGIDTPIEIVTFRGIKREAKTYPKYELMSMHIGRKTFVSISLAKGMIAEEVMSCTGHKSYNSFKRYVSIEEERKKAAMVKAWDAPADRAKLKAV